MTREEALDIFSKPDGENRCALRCFMDGMAEGARMLNRQIRSLRSLWQKLWLRLLIYLAMKMRGKGRVVQKRTHSRTRHSQV